MLKLLSTAAELAGTLKYFLAIGARDLYLASFAFQNNSAHCLNLPDETVLMKLSTKSSIISLFTG
jgi:hypothetical protein